MKTGDARLIDPPRGRWWVQLAVGVLVLWVTMVVTMALFEESLIFFPDRYPSGAWTADELARGTGTTIEDCFFTAVDGTRLHGWWCRPEVSGFAAAPTGEMILLWFHGNAGNLSQRAGLMLELALLPVQVFIVDYRGYGRSEGRPDEPGLYLDARAAWRYLVEGCGVDAERIVLLGKSLGGAVAVDLATEVEPAGLILQSSFSSVPDMAAHHYPFIPRWLVRTRMDSLSKIGRVRCPIMVVHSPADEVVPFEQGRRLFEAAPGDRRFLEIAGAAHNETSLVGGAEYFDAIRDFLIHCRRGRNGGA